MADIVFFPQKDAKYRSDEYEMVFIESGYDTDINNLVMSNYNLINDVIGEEGYHFIYLPFLYNELIATRCAQYYHPSLTDGGEQQISALNTSSYFKYLSNGLEPEMPPSVLMYIDTADGYDVYVCIRVDEEKLNDTDLIMGEYNDASYEYFSSKRRKGHGLVSEDANNGIRYSLRSKTDEDHSWLLRRKEDNLTLADKSWDYDTDTDRLYRELSAVVGDYVKKGLPLAILEKIIKEHTQISRMVIGENYEIRLTDYDMEIPFDSMEKSIYILFLNHPNGINFFDLPDHRKELESIYRTVTTRRNETSIMRTLNTVTDPMHDASINSYVSRIKKKLMTLMNPFRAQLYFITGKKGSEKYIPFAKEHSEMIEWL